MVNYESIYPGIQYTTLNPSYYSEPISGYQSAVGNLGAAVDPRTANQLGELNIKLNPGVKTIEIQGIQAQSWESIPDQHLDEMNRLSKLTGVEPTLHGELLDASGIIDPNQGYSEENRLGVEKQMESQVLRAHKLNPEGNVNVTFHSTVAVPEMSPTIKDDKGKIIEQGLFVINEESGQIGQIKPEKRYFPEGGEFTGKEIEFNRIKELERRNKESWTENISGINRYAEFGEESLNNARNVILRSAVAQTGEENIPPREEINQVIKSITKAMKTPDDLEKLKENIPEYKHVIDDAQRYLTHGQVYLRDSYKNMKSFFDKAWNNITNEDDRKKLEEFAKIASKKISSDFETDPEKTELLREVVDRGLRTLSNLKETPQLFKPLDQFVFEKSSQTFANVAEKAFNKFGNTAPIISIENPPYGQSGIATGEDLKKLVVKSREQLAKNLSNKGMSKSQAKNVAEKMIGATWDVGHINMMRKKGYSKEDVIKQTKEIAPFVKHVHLSDNFGLDHTELPMGMGNVPLKPMMKELKNAGFKGKEIIEAGNWWQFFAENGGGNPFKPSIEAFDSPIYAMKEGPGWANTGVYGAYYSGHGPINPAVHHNVYGAGFQPLPVELGGEIPGTERGRFAGTPNQ